MFNFLRPKKGNLDAPLTNEEKTELEELQSLSVEDVIASATSKVNVEDVVLDETTVVSEDIVTDETQTSTENEITETVNNEVKMEVNLEDIMAKVTDFLSGKTPEAQSSDAIEENGDEMEQGTQVNELEKVQEELKLANDKASELETAKADIEAKAQELQNQIDTMNAEKEAKRIESEKVELSKLVETKLSFVGGTVEENTEKLFELKSTLSEDLYNFVVDSLQSKSAIVESNLDEIGDNDTTTDTLTVDEQVDALVKAKLEANKDMKEAVAYTEVLEENPELKNAVYENIGK